MRLQNRNKRAISYANYNGYTYYEVDGLKTGEKSVTYTTPKEIMVSLSATKGNSDIEQFGSNLSYDRVIITDDMSCDITENTILWVDSPVYVNNVQQPHDYIVRRVAKSLNFISIAIQKVDVT